MAELTDVQVYAINESREVTGLVDTWHSLDLTLRLNRGGFWNIVLAANTAQAQLLGPSDRILIYRNGSPLMSGPVRSIQNVLSAGSAIPVVSISGIDDTSRLGHRLAWPDPSRAASDQSVTEYAVVTGAAETVVRTLIDNNAGPTAAGYTTPRDIPGLTLTADAAQGATVTSSTRWDNLGTESNDVALAGGVVFQILQDVDGALNLSFSEPSDVSSEITLSPELGNLRSWSYSLNAPTATQVTVAGSGEGILRITEGRTASADAWGERFEVLSDARDTGDLAVMAQRGDVILEEGAASGGLNLQPIDTPGRTFGVDYQLGDTVGVDIGDNGVFVDVVTEVRITATSSGELLRPVLGSAAASGASPLVYDRVADLNKRLSNLENRA
jgi:hypothetical protein